MSTTDTSFELMREKFEQCAVHRPMRLDRYEAGQILQYNVRGVFPAVEASVKLEIDKFVGGGFAGQVYRVKILAITGGKPEGLTEGSLYAMKILIPPSSGSVRFRNLVYFLGFQGPFSLQCNQAAARSGAIWQKFIRRAAASEIGDVRSVVDIYATFVDERMGSCGELSEWIEGRNWSFEVDDNLDNRSKWRLGDPVEADGLGAPEFRAKRQFMADMVKLFHSVGAPELARQYEWWTCKSQPNCLKRLDGGDGPSDGLTAVDFRAGLALLCWLPMSPGDILLIGRGLVQRGAMVQFDRGNVSKLRSYIAERPGRFDDMAEAVDELERCEEIYRNSLIDITHNHVRLLYSRRLWRGIFDSAVESWRIRRMADEKCAATLSKSRIMCLLFALFGVLGGLGSTLKSLGLLGLIGSGVAALFGAECWPGQVAMWSACAFGAGLVSAIVGRSLRTLWGRSDLRKHYLSMLGSFGYFRRALRAHACESVLSWLRDGRVTPEKAEKLADSGMLWLTHFPLSVLPAWIHRWLSDPVHAWRSITTFCTRPLRLYFDSSLREQWMRDMLSDGLKKGMVTPDEAALIEGQLSEPFIQKYLKSLAVHVATLPVTQVVSVAVALAMWDSSVDSTTNWVRSGVILGVFQIIPLSPGSLVRGLYVVYMAIKDRSYEKYNVALWLGFWKYIGYLSFPIQMARTYPEIARFMAGRWATGAVHIIPVFGEHGALAEHAVFDLFYNRPLTIRRRMTERAERRVVYSASYAQIVPAVLLAALIANLPGIVSMLRGNGFHMQANNWLLAAGAFIGGKIAARYAGGAAFGLRLLLGAACGVLAAVLVTTGRYYSATEGVAVWEIIKPAFLPAFGAVMASLAGALLEELKMKSPKIDSPAVTGPVKL